MKNENDASRADKIDEQAEAALALNPEYRDMYGMRYIGNEMKYFIPELSKSTLMDLRTEQMYLRGKNVSTRTLQKHKMSLGERFNIRLQKDRLSANFIPRSGWLEKGHYEFEGYESLYVGEGVERILPFESDFLVYREWENLLIPKERLIFRGLFGRVLKGFYDHEPVISPLLILSGSHAGQCVLLKLLKTLLGGIAHTEVSKNTLQFRPYGGHLDSILQVIGVRKNLENTYHFLRDHTQIDRTRIIANLNRSFYIPAFNFTVMLAYGDECMIALPDPGDDSAGASTIVLNVLDKVVPKLTPEAEGLEAPGYINDLLSGKDAEFVDRYFSPTIQQMKFDSNVTSNIFLFLESHYRGLKEVHTTEELLEKVKIDGRELVDLRQKPLVPLLKEMARSNPENLQRIDRKHWQLDFTKGEQL